MAEKKAKSGPRIKKDKHRSRLSDAFPNFGPGMFISLEAKASAERALVVLKKIIQDPRFPSDCKNAEPFQNMENQIIEIAAKYLSDKEYDNRLTYFELKQLFKPISSRIRGLAGALNDLPKAASTYFNTTMAVYSPGKRFSRAIDAVLADLDKMDRAIKPLLAMEKPKGKDQDRVGNACRSLWDLWETDVRVF